MPARGVFLAYYLKLYFSTLLVFFAVDMVWLGLVARTFYSKYLGYLMAPGVNWPAAILFYLLFIVGILVFVVLPGLKSGSTRDMLLRAALFGLITYATYDLTNLAILKDWPVMISVVDMAWGTTLSVIVSYAGLMIGRRLNKNLTGGNV
jgi:uncharacterized membrane protein